MVLVDDESGTTVLSGTTPEGFSWTVSVEADSPSNFVTMVTCADGQEKASMGFGGPKLYGSTPVNYWTGRAGFGPELTMLRVDAARVAGAVATSTSGTARPMQMSQEFPEWGLRFGFVASHDPTVSVELVGDDGGSVAVSHIGGGIDSATDGGGWRAQ